MTKSNVEFQAIKAYGNVGDRKNDGFVQTSGTYYQVFSPEDITKNQTIKECISKLKEDFTGLYKNWNGLCKIKNFFFVINDRYKGISPPIIEAIMNLDNDPNYTDVKISIFSAKDLEEVFDSLDETKKQDVIGFIPDEVIPIVEYDALHETVLYLLNKEIDMSSTDALVVPDFGEKIKFNKLSSAVEPQLITGSYQDGILREYFNENPGVKEILQKKFQGLYEQSKMKIANNIENFADCRFYYILEQACPKKTISIKTSVIVLMAYYFSSCDIFEEPQ